MSAWDEVLASALVGTERRPPPTGALASLGLDVDSSGLGADHALLAAAGALGAWRRAGFVPRSDVELPPPAPADARRPASAAAAQILELLVKGGVSLPCTPRPLVEQWLRCADAGGWAVPERLLPDVLDLAVLDADLRTVVLAGVGARGRWLAAQHEPWSKAFGAGMDVTERFATGTRGERMEALRQLREHDPAAARELLAEAWSTEKAGDRAEFIEVLETGLSDDDEPFLEAALDDRAGSVRSAAAHVLDGLPSSRRAQRMAARLAPLVSVGGLLRKHIDVAFPDEPDAAMRRDGIDDNRPPSMGERAWWLAQLVRAAPLSFWEQSLRLDPADIVRMGSKELVEGWTNAAYWQRDSRWAAVLFKATRNPVVLAAVASDEAASLVEPALAKLSDMDAMRTLVAVPGPWTQGFSKAALARAQALPPIRVGDAAPFLAMSLDPSTAPDVEDWSRSIADERLRRVVRGIHHAVTLRDTIAKELS